MLGICFKRRVLLRCTLPEHILLKGGTSPRAIGCSTTPAGFFLIFDMVHNRSDDRLQFI